MGLENKRIVIGITSSFYAIEKTIPQIKKLIEEGADIIPIMSFNCYNLDFKGFTKQIEEITGRKIIHTIEDAEPIGHKFETDIMAIIPCTGNTIGKLANGIIDTSVLVAAKTNLKRRKQYCNWYCYKWWSFYWSWKHWEIIKTEKYFFCTI